MLCRSPICTFLASDCPVSKLVPSQVLFIHIFLSHCLYCLYDINLCIQCKYVYPIFKLRSKLSSICPLKSMWQGSQPYQPTVSCEPDQPSCAGSKVDVGLKKSATTKLKVVVMVTTPPFPPCMQVNGTSAYMTLSQ